MTAFKTLITACFMALLFASCGSDSKEKLTEDAMSANEEMVGILEGVKDKATAETAKPKLEALAKKIEGLKDRQKALNISDEDMKKEMEKHKDRMVKVMGKMMATMMKISTNKEINDVLGETMKKINK